MEVLTGVNSRSMQPLHFHQRADRKAVSMSVGCSTRQDIVKLLIAVLVGKNTGTRSDLLFTLVDNAVDGF
ncbi:hypothetical protein D3C73_1446460 [compost metagenome]